MNNANTQPGVGSTGINPTSGHPPGQNTGIGDQVRHASGHPAQSEIASGKDASSPQPLNRGSAGQANTGYNNPAQKTAGYDLGHEHASPVALDQGQPTYPAGGQSGGYDHRTQGNVQNGGISTGQEYTGAQQPPSSTQKHGQSASRGADAPDQNPTSYERSNAAESSMTDAAKTRIAKNEGRDGKKMKKVLKEESQAEDNLLKAKIKDLGRHQKLHKQAAKDEAAAVSLHSKAVKVEHRLNMSALAANAKHESAAADLKAKEERLAVSKKHSQEQNQILKDKRAEVEQLREKKAVDDREREAKRRQLTANPATVG